MVNLNTFSDKDYIKVCSLDEWNKLAIYLDSSGYVWGSGRPYTYTPWRTFKHPVWINICKGVYSTSYEHDTDPGCKVYSISQILNLKRVYELW